MRTQEIGAMTIRKIVEMDGLAIPAGNMFGNAAPDLVRRGREWLDHRFLARDSDDIFLSFHSYVLETKGRKILIDTCNGNDKTRRGPVAFAHMMKTDYLGNLARAGLKPEDIDLVFCTHLHIDHVGWNTKLENGRWVPTFPNAKYLMSRVDFEFFDQDRRVNPDGMNADPFVDSVLPVVEAGRAELVETDHVVFRELDDGVWLEGAAGHTPGSILLHAQNRHGHAVFSGDIVHHPLQIMEPSLYTLADHDTEMATATRRRMIETCADTGTLLMTAHFQDPTAGRIVSARDGFRFRFDGE